MSHHPPAAAHHAFSEKGWTLRQEITLASKFRGKYLSIMPLGTCMHMSLQLRVRIHILYAKTELTILLKVFVVYNPVFIAITQLFTFLPNNVAKCQALFLSSGSIQCLFDKSNNHYSWKKVTTTVHNIIVGKLWIDQVIIKSYRAKRCNLTYFCLLLC